MILAAKTDGLINCIVAPEHVFGEEDGITIDKADSSMTDEEKDKFSEMDNIQEDYTPQPAQEEEPQDEEGQGKLFTDEQVPVVEKVKKPKPPKEPKPKKERKPFNFGKISWFDKVGKTIGNLYEGVGASVKEAMEDRENEEA